MHKIILTKGKGKTTQLIKLSSSTKGVIVTSTSDRAKKIIREAKSRHLSIPDPITYGQLFRKDYEGREIPGFLIDDVDLFLNYTVSLPVIALTLDPLS